MKNLLLLALLPFLLPFSDNHRFGSLKTVEAYQVRPGIIMMPRYAKDGQVCEEVIDSLHYTAEGIRIDPSISPKVLHDIFEELVPAAERGKLIPQLGGQKSITMLRGGSSTTFEEYEHVQFQIHGSAAADVVATIKWKNVECR